MATWHWPLAMALALSAVPASPAAAADIWVLGSTADKQTYIFADAATLAPQAGAARSMSLYEVFVGDSVQKEGAKYFLLSVSFDCGLHEFSNRTLTVYDPSGKVIGQSNFPNPQYQAASAGSPGAMALGFACTAPSAWSPTYYPLGG